MSWNDFLNEIIRINFFTKEYNNAKVISIENWYNKRLEKYPESGLLPYGFFNVKRTHKEVCQQLLFQSKQNLRRNHNKRVLMQNRNNNPQKGA